MSNTNVSFLENLLTTAKNQHQISKNAILAKLELSRPPLSAIIANLCQQYGLDFNFVLAIIAHETGLLTLNELIARRNIDVGFFQLNYHPEVSGNVGPVEQWRESNRSPLPDPYTPEGNAEIGIWYIRWILDYVRKSLSDPPMRGSIEELTVLAAGYHGLWTLKDYKSGLGVNSLKADYYWPSVMKFFNQFRSENEVLTNNLNIGINLDAVQPRYSTTLLEAINQNDLSSLPAEEADPVSGYTPETFPEAVALLDKGYLRINDIEFEDIPPSQISVVQESMHKQSAALRASSNAFLRTGQSRINVQIILDFVDLNAPGKPYIPVEDYINEKLRPLLAQFQLTPFCQVSNAHLASQIYNLGVAASTDLQTKSTIALALTDMILATHPESPGGLRLALNFIYFNYQAFSNDFSYLEDYTKETWLESLNPTNKSKSLFNAPPSAVESKAFKKFYAPKLAMLREMDGPLSSFFSLSFSPNPLGSKNPFVPRSGDSNPPELVSAIAEANKLEEQSPEVVSLDTPSAILDNSGGLKVLNISISLRNHLSTIPLLSWEYPTIQFLGARDIEVMVDFQSIGHSGAHEELAKLRRFHALVDRKAISNKVTRKHAITAVNDVLSVFGISSVIINNLETHTTESPELLVGRLSFAKTNATPTNDHNENTTFDYISTNQNRSSFYKELLKKFIDHYGLYYFLYPNQELPFNQVPISDPYGHVIAQIHRIPTLRGEIIASEGSPNNVSNLLIDSLQELFESNIKDFILDYDPFDLANSLLDNESFKRLRDEFLESAFDPENATDTGPLQKVVEVVDGDTVKLDDGTIVSIRLLSVNTPEIAHEEVPGSIDQPGGQDAKRFLTDLLLNKMVRANVKGIDVFGRKLTYLYLPDGTSVSGLIAAMGYQKGRRIFNSEGVRSLGRWFELNYQTIYNQLTTDEQKSLDAIAHSIGTISGINYPDFHLAISEGESHIEGIPAQELNPDFYFYNRHEDPEFSSKSVKKIADQASRIIQTQYELYANFLFREATRGRLDREQDRRDFDIQEINVANNFPVEEKNVEGGIINYNPKNLIEHHFDPTTLSKLLKETVTSYAPQQYKMRRAYPTFQIYFLEEDDVQFGWRSYNDFYSTDTIEFIMVTKSRKIAADTAYVRLNNFTGELTKKKFSKVDPETLVEDVRSQDYPLVDTINENPAADLIFKEGTRIQIRLGYENNPNKLPIVFNGIITSMSGTDTIEIYCQTFAIELVNTLASSNPSGMTQLAPGINLLNYNSNYAIRYLFQKLLRQPGVSHFGRWTVEDGIDLWAPLRANTPGLDYAREIRPDGQLVPKWSYFDTPADDNIFIPEFNQDETRLLFPEQFIQDFLLKLTPDALRNWIEVNSVAIYQALPGFLQSPNAGYLSWDSLSLRQRLLWINPFYSAPSSSIWDVTQELTLRYPGFICSPVPFDDRMTLFFGHPNQIYCWRDETLAESLTNPARTEELGSLALLENTFPAASLKPFRNYYFVTSYHDIIANEIRADFNGTITVAHIGWSAADDDKPRNTTTIKLDDSIPDPDSFEADAFPGAYRDALFNEINVHTEEEAARYGVSYLCQSLHDLYKGELILIGNGEIKPYDVIFIYDDYNDMAGPVQVEQVVHTFSPEYGFTSTITPDCMVEPGETFNLSYMKAMAHAHTTLYKETNEALVGLGWTPRLSGIITGLGGISSIMRVNYREPIIITPLIRNGVPWVNGISAFQKGNYWLEWGGKMVRYFDAFKDGVGYFKDNLYRVTEESFETYRRAKINWEF